MLLGNETLKKKFDVNDAMTSLLIWRALLPTSINPSPPNYPIPPINKLVPVEYSKWNSLKGGSDTATRFTYNCQLKLPNKKPQSYVTCRLLELEGILFHRVSQAVTGRKKPDIHVDTMRTVRDRNNKRMAFHHSLDWLIKRLLKEAHPSRSKAASMTSNISYKVERAARYTNGNKDSRHETNHQVLGAVGVTGVTPLGRGGRKTVKNRTAKHDEYDKRCAECEGKPARLVVKRAIPMAMARPRNPKRLSTAGMSVIFAERMESLGTVSDANKFFVLTRIEVKTFAICFATKPNARSFVKSTNSSLNYQEMMHRPIVLK